MTSNTQLLELAGVPVICSPPANTQATAPLIILWHGFGVPNSEEILATTLPLSQVQAWKVYLGLPLFGKRLPSGGIEEAMHRYVDDYVLKFLLPIVEQAAEELPAVVNSLQAKFNIDTSKGIGLFGFSAGTEAVLLALTRSDIKVSAAVVAGAGKNLEMFVNAYEQYFDTLQTQFPWMEEKHKTYRWSKESETAKQCLDFDAVIQQVVKRDSQPALLFIHGAQDEIFPVSDIEKIYAALKPHYQQRQSEERLSLEIFQNLKHQIDIEAASESPEISKDIITLQSTVANWFAKYLNPFLSL